MLLRHPSYSEILQAGIWKSSLNLWLHFSFKLLYFFDRSKLVLVPFFFRRFRQKLNRTEPKISGIKYRFLLSKLINVLDLNCTSIVSGCDKIFHWNLFPFILAKGFLCIEFWKLFERLLDSVSLFQNPFRSLFLAYWCQFGNFILFLTATVLWKILLQFRSIN